MRRANHREIVAASHLRRRRRRRLRRPRMPLLHGSPVHTHGQTRVLPALRRRSPDCAQGSQRVRMRDEVGKRQRARTTCGKEGYRRGRYLRARTARQALDRAPQPHAPTVVHHRAVVGTARHLPALSHVVSRLTNPNRVRVRVRVRASASTRTGAGHSRGAEVKSIAS